MGTRGQGRGRVGEGRKRETHLDTGVTLCDADCVPTRTGIEQADFAIATGRDEEVARGVKRDALNRIPMSSQHALRALRAPEIPQLDRMFTRRSSQHMLSRGMPHDLSHASRRNIDPQHRLKVARLPMFRAPSFERMGVDFPEEGFAVFAGGGDEGVVKGGPVGVEDGGGVASR